MLGSVAMICLTMRKLLVLPLLGLGVLGTACFGCDESIEVNNPAFPCMIPLEISSVDGTDSCDGRINLRGFNTCSEALIFPGDTGPMTFEPDAEILISLNPLEFIVEGPHNRNHEFPVTKGSQTLIYKFSVN